MRNATVIILIVLFLLAAAVYGAITVVYSRLSRAGNARRYSVEMDDVAHLHTHDVYIRLPGGISITGEENVTGVLQVGFLKLPVSHREKGGWLMIFLVSVAGVALGAYVWRQKIADLWMPFD